MKMNDKKNIDRLFQEKLKDFEVTPDEIVWERIKAHQNEKRRALLPFWYKFAGVAALVAIIFGVSFFMADNSQQPKNTITNANSKNETKKQQDLHNDTPVQKKNDIVSSEKERSNIPSKGATNEYQSHDPTINSYTIKSSDSDQNAVTKKTTDEQSLINYRNKLITSSSAIYNQIVEASSKTVNNSKKQPLLHKKTDTILSKNNIAKNTISDPKNENLIPNKKLPFLNTPHIKHTSDSLSIAESDKGNQKTEDIKKDKDINAHKKSIFDVINNKEDIVEESTSTRKWNISPTIAPVYYSSLGNGSPIDSQFADNTKSGQVNMSYGLQVAYAINKRFSIRSGVSKVDLSYHTEDVGFTPSASLNKNLESVDYNTSSEAILVSDIGNVGVSEFTDVTRNATNTTQNIGLLNQSIGYIEVPLEMKYALVNKKIGINMIGGMSTLFLQDNEISIEAGDFETPIGKANNLNEVSFSGNIGLGIDYKITKQLEINLEPIFKYQLNTFNTNTDNFKPYYFGVYTGVSIKF